MQREYEKIGGDVLEGGMYLSLVSIAVTNMTKTKWGRKDMFQSTVIAHSEGSQGRNLGSGTLEERLWRNGPFLLTPLHAQQY